MTTGAGEGVGPSIPVPRAPTQTRKAIHSLLPTDHAQLCRQITTVSAQLRALIAAKNELEMQAAVAGITLYGPAGA